MRVLLAHNRYRLPGGEDAAVESEGASLERAGVVVERLLVSSESIEGPWQTIQAAVKAPANATFADLVKQAIERFGPDIVHFHNTFPLLSPQSVRTSVELGVPTVATLHNYRIICANGLLMRKDAPCEDCVGRARWPAVVHRCYRQSAIGSFLVARTGKAFRQAVDDRSARLRLIALTRFAKERFVRDGFDADRIVVKGNAASDYGAGPEKRERRLVFVGRLSREKGADFLVGIASRLRGQIEILGAGPDLDALRQAAPPNVSFRGWVPHEEVVAHIRTAAAVVVPSRWYEGFPMAVVDSYATATPVVASGLGSLAELVSDGETGRILPPGDAGAWVAALNQLLDHPAAGRALGQRAREVYLERHSEQRNVDKLLDIYDSLLRET